MKQSEWDAEKEEERSKKRQYDHKKLHPKINIVGLRNNTSWY